MYPGRNADTNITCARYTDEHIDANANRHPSCAPPCYGYDYAHTNVNLYPWHNTNANTNLYPWHNTDANANRDFGTWQCTINRI